jgi:hydroxymethylpyrimidine kinase/phosphomethylpyrimidine kinase
MREPTPTTPPVALSVAGSDSGGGAGIQADLQTMAAQGVYGTTAITAVTAQNTRGVEGSHALPPDVVAAQYDAVLADFEVGAIKTGMLANVGIVETVADRIGQTRARTDGAIPTVVDPVMVATSGDRLLEPDAEAAYEDLIAEATLVTPNADEAAVLTDVEVTDVETAEAAGEALRELGVDAALVKGGHVAGDPVRDVLVTAEGTRVFEHERVDTDATHGSGCALSSAIAARLARNEPLPAAAEEATDFLERAVAHHYDVGQGPGAVNHLVDLRVRTDGDDA